MKKQLTLVAGLMLIGLFANGQSCEAIKAENVKLKAEIAALKRSSNPVKSGSAFSAQTQTDNKMFFTVTDVVGDKRNQTVTLTVSIVNKGANVKAYSTKVSSFVDENGDEFDLKMAMLGKSSSESGLTPNMNLYTNVPLKAVYVFKGVMPKTTKIKILPLPYINSLGEEIGKVEFRDLPISWK